MNNITIELIRSMLAWCTLINFVLIALYAVLFMACHQFIYRLHSKVFKMTEESFYKLHYMALIIYKTGFILFNLVPYLALRILA